MARLKAVGTSDANYANQGEVIRKIRQEEEFMTAMSEAPSTSTTFKIYKLTDTKRTVNTTWKVLTMSCILKEKGWSALGF